MSAVLRLDEILRRHDVWRGDRLASAPLPGVASGYARLDAELPGGGWPRGTLIEILPAHNGIGEISLLLPALQQLVNERPLVVLAPPWRANAPAWAQALPGARVWVIEAAGADAAWCAELLLDAGAAAILAWLPGLDGRALRRLQVASEGRTGMIWLFRPPAAAHNASPAPLRLTLAAAPPGLSVHILKRRGPPCTQALLLPVSRPGTAAQIRMPPKAVEPTHALACTGIS